MIFFRKNKLINKNIVAMDWIEEKAIGLILASTEIMIQLKVKETTTIIEKSCSKRNF